MSANPLQARHGFNRYELLAVVGIIGILLFGLGRAVQKVRDNANRMETT